jgi:nicotinamide-nucleotide amidase
MIDTQQCGQNVGYAAIFIFFKDLIMDFLFQYLKENNLTLSSCESFTAGLFAHEFCLQAGSSQFFKGSFVCYSNDFKEQFVEIDNRFIKKYGVVSQEVAELMARNCARLLATDVCFSFTGFAPISDEAQVGLSYASIFINGKVYTDRFYQPDIQDRKAYQQRAIEAILIFFQKNVLN